MPKESARNGTDNLMHDSSSHRNASIWSMAINDEIHVADTTMQMLK